MSITASYCFIYFERQLTFCNVTRVHKLITATHLVNLAVVILFHRSLIASVAIPCVCGFFINRLFNNAPFQLFLARVFRIVFCIAKSTLFHIDFLLDALTWCVSNNQGPISVLLIFTLLCIRLRRVPFFFHVLCNVINLPAIHCMLLIRMRAFFLNYQVWPFFLIISVLSASFMALFPKPSNTGLPGGFGKGVAPRADPTGQQQLRIPAPIGVKRHLQECYVIAALQGFSSLDFNRPRPCHNQCVSCTFLACLARLSNTVSSSQEPLLDNQDYFFIFTEYSLGLMVVLHSKTRMNFC